MKCKTSFAKDKAETHRVCDGNNIIDELCL